MTKNIGKIISVKKEDRKEALTIEELNAIFTPLSFKERIEKLYTYFSEEEVLMTSSFGTKSVFLLHLLHQIRPSQRIHFINTSYHFPETISYKEQLSQLFDLDIIEVLPHPVQNKLTTEEEWWTEHPKMCCTINKVAPLEPIVARHNIWISGLMAYQTDFRSHLRVFEKQGDIIKFHPLIDINEGEFLYHLDYYQLPKHPLQDQGYDSIGCSHCTLKGKGREGRWLGTQKTECGLHPNYFNKKKTS